MPAFCFAPGAPAASGSDSAPTHAYPSSSRKRHNWDDIVKQSAAEDEQLQKEFAKDPNAGGDRALNEMFQKLYADATDDQRRAMIKSYQESNGTALSTDWSDVSKASLPLSTQSPGRACHLMPCDPPYIENDAHATSRCEIIMVFCSRWSKRPSADTAF